MERLGGFLRLIRPVNCLMAGFAVLVGASLRGWEVFSPDLRVNLLLGFVTGFTLTGASMAINDFYDADIDAVDKPDRPIPSGALSPREALSLALVLTVMGFAAALRTSGRCLVVAVAAWAVFVAYSAGGKRTGLPGNALVSGCVATPFVYGNLAVGWELELTAALFAAVAFLSNMGREVTKGIADVEGDRAGNVRTVAVRRGERAAASVASAFYLSAVGLSLVPWRWGLVSPWFLPLVALADAGFVLSTLLLLRDPSREGAKRVKTQVLAWMTLGMTAFVAGTLGP